ncbi:MAG: diguanylate cyclase [Aminobacterium sp.]|jgi:two-component system cell cycle response regulator|uniref:GGDEF domain-containing response regulator n=1 Tax=unclassified Aminobacterium TaxID=2685012 RepID=UPI001BCB3892|nr:MULTISPECIES: diguanylate cyclase [unclassified Aminobacterium]MDD2206403.1 diguanylate cyclase [Aminobacterium sp.]MDD3425389.1 diguanylate cyclase [Aminobacterium sp.]MDD4228262.1 diguanylate cyclase [Aminobacterium sp.]MDD4551299.1 diguanylate cyclase [Aminobacterium sp.]MEA4877286.1 diguanylate cyclase [Aminobacterium sp.]
MKVLVAEDDVTSRFMLKSLLEKWGYDVITASNGEEAWHILREENAPKLAVVDWMMSGLEGPDICKKLRVLEEEKKHSTYTYVIMLTVRDEKENILAGLEAGADDYITKPFDAQELRLRVGVGKRIVDLQEALRFYADHDPLTGLLNRRAIFERLDHEMARSRRENRALSVAILDVDHFKQVNDTYGHLAGDDVLRETALRIQDQLRKYDVVGRYGGEEFLIVLPGVALGEALKIAERVRKNIVKTTFGEKEILLSASLGVAEYDKISGVDEIIFASDTALYKAKKRGRNQVGA